jgi:methylated-DNA-protein-cysteine methyltransferase-like protein
VRHNHVVPTRGQTRCARRTSLRRLPDFEEPDFEEAVLHAIRDIPRGAVASYGSIAEEAGRPRAARAVGRILALTGEPVPWWRVVRADGRLTSPDAGEQAARLLGEGVAVRDGRVCGMRRP